MENEEALGMSQESHRKGFREQLTEMPFLSFLKKVSSKENPDNKTPLLASPSMETQLSRRDLLKKVGKVGIALAATSPLVEFLSACSTEEDRSLTENEKEVLVSVNNFNEFYNKFHEQKGLEQAVTTSLAGAIASLSDDAGIENTYVTFDKSFDQIVADHEDADNRFSHFLAFATIQSNTSVEEMKSLIQESKEIDPKIKDRDSIVIAGYSAIFGKSPLEINELMVMAGYEVNGNSSLFLALVEGGNPAQTLALHESLKGEKYQDELTFLAQRNGGDLEATKELFDQIHPKGSNDFKDHYTDSRLVMASIVSQDSAKVLEMFKIADKKVRLSSSSGGNGVASSLVLATLDNSPSGQLFARSIPLMFEGTSGLTSNPASPMYSSTSSSFNYP